MMNPGWSWPESGEGKRWCQWVQQGRWLEAVELWLLLPMTVKNSCSFYDASDFCNLFALMLSI